MPATAMSSLPPTTELSSSTGPGLPAQGTRGANRLRRRQDFVTVLREGRRHRHRLLSLGVRPNGLPYNRYGYAIGKRVGAAVVRNRVRRRLREVIRALSLAPGHDLVLTAGEASATATFEQLREAVRFCADRGGLLRSAPILTNSVQTS